MIPYLFKYQHNLAIKKRKNKTSNTKFVARIMTCFKQNYKI